MIKININNVQRGTVEFYSEITKSLNFTAEHTENAEAPKNPNTD